MLGRMDGEGKMAGELGIWQTSHVRNPQEGPQVMVGSMQVTVKATGAETGGRFALLEVTVPPYFADAWPHLHQQTAEAIYLTQGMLAVTLGEETTGEETMVVRQGTFILVPPKQAHRFWNPTATPATFLIYFSPAGAEGFFEALSRMEGVEAARLPNELPSELPSELAELWALAMRYDHFPISHAISSSVSSSISSKP